MIIAIASGKGGTGKTTVATSLTLAVGDLQLLDCDVEEPNAYHFMRPTLRSTRSIYSFIPVFREDKCTGCGKCVEFCQSNALALVKKKVLLFPELCHSCGGCKLVCPTGAILEDERKIGSIQIGTSRGRVEFIEGLMEVGAPSGVPIIRTMKELMDGDAIIDCAPGAACNTIEAMEGSDYVILVTEPTPFGLHDLQIAVQTAKHMELPFGVIINRYGIGYGGVEDYCSQEGIDILLKIPQSRDIARGYSSGITLTDLDSKWRESFRGVYRKIREVVA
jgi:MinD superfamily P-loop ATPase